MNMCDIDMYDVQCIYTVCMCVCVFVSVIAVLHGAFHD